MLVDWKPSLADGESTKRRRAGRQTRHWAVTRIQTATECCTNNVSGDTRPSRIDTGKPAVRQPAQSALVCPCLFLARSLAVSLSLCGVFDSHPFLSLSQNISCLSGGRPSPCTALHSSCRIKENACTGDSTRARAMGAHCEGTPVGRWLDLFPLQRGWEGAEWSEGRTGGARGSGSDGREREVLNS